MSFARTIPRLALSAAAISAFVAFDSPVAWPYTLPPLAFLTLWSVRLAHRET